MHGLVARCNSGSVPVAASRCTVFARLTKCRVSCLLGGLAMGGSLVLEVQAQLGGLTVGKRFVPATKGAIGPRRQCSSSLVPEAKQWQTLTVLHSSILAWLRSGCLILSGFQSVAKMRFCSGQARCLVAGRGQVLCSGQARCLVGYLA